MKRFDEKVIADPQIGNDIIHYRMITIWKIVAVKQFFTPNPMMSQREVV